MEDIRKGDAITITHKLRESGKGLVLSIPKGVVELMALDKDTMVEASIRKVERVMVLEKGVIPK